MFLPLLLFTLGQVVSGADESLPPQGSTLVTTAEAHGVQVYRCTSQPQGFQWRLDAPYATLQAPGKGQASGKGADVGMLTLGPTWTWNDGSSIRGTNATTRAAASADSLPGELLKATPVSTATGLLGNVIWVRLSEVSGGAAPGNGCDALHEGELKQVPFQATYTFYTGPKHDPVRPSARPSSVH